MPDSVMSRLPIALNALEAAKLPTEAGAHFLDAGIRSMSLGWDAIGSLNALNEALTERFLAGIGCDPGKPLYRLAGTPHQIVRSSLEVLRDVCLRNLRQMKRERSAELAFIRLFTEPVTAQDWTVAYDDSRVMLDLPGMRVIDISAPVRHRIRNYTVLFAPRAGHHSNIAERVALYLRDRGLTRMAVVEQKCAADIPLYVDGQRHSEDFTSQVAQYRQVLEMLEQIAGKPAHLIAICQPGPLLISTLILNPHLGKTFGSAGSPMHTEAERGFLTDFARLMGDGFIDRLMTLFGRTIEADRSGSGRECYDGAFQILGFYYLGMDQHLRNFKRLLADLKQGDIASAERQTVFYRWYNTAHHFPVGFIRDTYKKIFIQNELVHKKLAIGEKTIGIQDYPESVPIWALGGKTDNIAPPQQATAHLDLIRPVREPEKLRLICEGGHMALFRSARVLDSQYARIADFILRHSDPAAW